MLIAGLLSLPVGVVLGLLGGGGSILMVPALVYGLGMSPERAIPTSLVVVGITAAAASVQHYRQGNVRLDVGLPFAAAGMVGAFAGGAAAGWFSGHTLLLLFAGMMVAAAVAMLRGRKEPAEGVEHRAHSGLAILADGLVLGSVTGLIGAGGGFLIVPALVLLGGLPMKQAVGTSLLVIALNAAAGFGGQATHIVVDWSLIAVITSFAVVGSLLGSQATSKLPAKALRRGFGGLVLVLAVVMLAAEL